MAKADFFDTFKSRWKLAVDAEQEQRENELADLRFEAGEHWDAAVKRERERQGKMCLTIDLISGPIKQVTNQQRTARPGIQISPVGNGADPKKAERWQGIIRRIERLSQANRAYAWAGQYQAKMGRGFWVVRNVEVGEDGEQDIRIEEVDNQHTWYCDPNTKKLDGSDKRWAIGYQDLTHEEYIARFGDSKLADGLSEGQFRGGVGIAPPDWITSSHCRIAEYFHIEETKRYKHVLSDGSSAYEDELETEVGREKGRFAKKPKFPDGVTSKRRVPKVTKKVYWCLLNGLGEKLEETVIPGEFIPVVRIYAERRNIDGKVDYRGLVRMAKDPNRMEDWAESSLLEAISDAKTAPWLAEYDQIAEFETAWKDPRSKVLFYRRQSGENGSPIPPPQKISSGVDVQALTVAAQRMENHVRRTTGIPDTFTNESAQEQSQLSGRAILARRQQQELGTSDYLENLGDGIVLTAKIIMSMARDGVYDTPRLMRIWGDDEKEESIVTHYGPEQQEQALQLMSKDVSDLFDIKTGEYDIAISMGRNKATQRQDTQEVMEMVLPVLAKTDPQAAVKAAAQMLKAMDNPDAIAIGESMDPEGNEPNPAKMQQQLQMADQLMQQMQQRIQELEMEKQAGIAKEQARGEAQKQIEALKGQLEDMLQRQEYMFKLQLQNDQQAHEAAMAAAEAAQAKEQAERDTLTAMAQMGANEKPVNGNGSSKPSGGAQ